MFINISWQNLAKMYDFSIVKLFSAFYAYGIVLTKYRGFQIIQYLLLFIK